MTFAKKNLNPNETVALDMHPHWWYFAGPAVSLFLAIVLGIYVGVGLDDDLASFEVGARAPEPPPPVAVLTLTMALMLAPGATATLAPPFKVTEPIVRLSVNSVVATAPESRPLAVSRSDAPA